MSADLSMKLDYHNGDGLTVDMVDGDVRLQVQPEVDAYQQRWSRGLRPDEARALAAALVHFAAEAER